MQHRKQERIKRNKVILHGRKQKLQLLAPKWLYALLRVFKTPLLHQDTHAGKQRILKMAQDRYLWPGMGHDIKCYIKTCTACKQATSRQALACQASRLPDWVDLLQNRPQQPDQGGKIIRRLQKSLIDWQSHLLPSRSSTLVNWDHQDLMSIWDTWDHLKYHIK